MKAVGCVVVVALAAVGGFLALLLWTLGRSEDKSGLTEQVEAVVVGEPRDVGQAPSSSWRFDYAYEVAGRWYGAEDDISDDVWDPGHLIFVCFDPADPTEHVLNLGLPCDQEQAVTGLVAQATERPAP